jgi:hypothetical protein
MKPATHASIASTSPPPKKDIEMKKGAKTYNSWDSLVVTHPTTNQPI